MGLTATSFKTRWRNHQTSFNNEKGKNSTELSKYVSELKSKDQRYTIEWKILEKAKPYTNLTGLLVGRGKKSQISRDFQGQIREKNGRFRGNFAGIFEAILAEKRLVKNGRFRESFPSKFRWKVIGFALIWGKFSMKLDALIDYSGFIPQYESVLYK